MQCGDWKNAMIFAMCLFAPSLLGAEELVGDRELAVPALLIPEESPPEELIPEELIPVVGSEALALPGYTVRRWTTADGLPMNSINEATQSRRGDLLLATFGGLVRFDGVRFQVLGADSRPALPTNRISGFQEAVDGALWIHTEQHQKVRLPSERGAETEVVWNGETGLPHFFHDVKTRRFRFSVVITEDRVFCIETGSDFPFSPKDFGGRKVEKFYRDGRGRYWLASHQGLGRFADGVLQWIDLRDSLGSSNVRDFDIDDQGNLWIVVPHALGVMPVDCDAGDVESGECLPIVVDRFEHTDTALIYAFAQDLTFLYMGDQARYYRERTKVLEIPFRGDRYAGFGGIPMRLDATGRKWTMGRDGVYRDDRLVFLTTRLEDAIRSVEIDHEGTIWIATSNQGLFALIPDRVATLHSDVLQERNFYSLHEAPDGDLWMATLTDAVYRLKNPRIEDGRPTGEIQRISGESIRSMYEDRTGRIFGTWSQLVTLAPEGSPAPYAPLPTGGLGTDWINTMYRDASDRLLFGTTGPIYASRPGDPQDGEWRFHAPPEFESVVRARFFHTSRGEPGTVWIGSGGSGLIRYRAGEPLLHLATENGLPSNSVRDVYEDEDGILWIAMEDHGLARFDPQTVDAPQGPDVVMITKRDGLWDDSLHRILDDDFGRLWISTNRGIFRVRKSDLDAFVAGEIPRIEVVAYTEQDGMLNREANGGVQNAGLRARDGTLWFPTQESVVAIDPASIDDSLVAPPVYVEEVLVQGEPADADAEGVLLRAQQRTFDVAFTAYSFRAPDRVMFRYRLEGYAEAWNTSQGADRSARYTKVPPGEYVFRVLARSSEGIWNEEGAALTIRVEPFFWETNLFRGAALLAFALGIWGVVLFRERHQLARRRELEQIVDQRTESLSTALSQLQDAQEQLVEQKKLASLGRLTAEIAHEIRNPLNFINNFAELSVELTEDLAEEIPAQDDEARELLEDLAGNVRRIAEHGKRADTVVSGMLIHTREAGTQAVPTQLNALLQASLSLAEGAEDSRIRVEQSYDENVGEVRAIAQDLRRAFVNVLENAFDALQERIERGDDFEPVLEISTQLRGDQAAVIFRDSGVGVAEEHLGEIFQPFMTTKDPGKGTGLGLSVAQDIIVRKHDGEILASSRLGEGTEILVLLPCLETP